MAEITKISVKVEFRQYPAALNPESSGFNMRWNQPHITLENKMGVAAELCTGMYRISPNHYLVTVNEITWLVSP